MKVILTKTTTQYNTPEHTSIDCFLILSGDNAEDLVVLNTVINCDQVSVNYLAEKGMKIAKIIGAEYVEQVG